jgi:hypothetical protein
MNHGTFITNADTIFTYTPFLLFTVSFSFIPGSYGQEDFPEGKCLSSVFSMDPLHYSISGNDSNQM